MWQQDENTGAWSLESDWKVRPTRPSSPRPPLTAQRRPLPSPPTRCPLQAHDAAISKVSWAHPEFGTILATASFDRTVKVWEQTSAADPDAAFANGAGAGPSGARWTERAALLDAKGTVRAVEFAPHHFGLKLVSGASRSPFSCGDPMVDCPARWMACGGASRRRSRRTTTCACTSASSSPRSPPGSSLRRSTC